MKNKKLLGVVEYDVNGNPICGLCGKAYTRILSHVRQKHDMTEREYKLKFGLDLKKGICSLASAQKSRDKVLLNYDKCVEKNLIKGGAVSRFVDGSKGRTKEMVSEQTKKMLKDRLKTPQMVEAMRVSGKRLGETGLGNKVRWASQQEK